MSIDKAKDYYLGRCGNKRLNCAEAVLFAFKEHFDIEDKEIEKFTGRIMQMSGMRRKSGGIHCRSIG